MDNCNNLLQSEATNGKYGDKWV
uniref:Uncharacterized protein n=1 Tax=Rhizophora mucronata TaxID=61149 RepID=A0A2P2QJ03_RHIMU